MFSAKRVLCADDHRDTCDMLVALLRSTNLKPRSAINYEQLISAIEQERFDLYVLDSTLPGAEGRSILKEVKSLDKNAKFIIYSGHASDEDRKRGLAEGADAYVVKPLIEELVAAVRTLLAE
jgi:DNA-binding response OmpR family regulator